MANNSQAKAFYSSINRNKKDNAYEIKSRNNQISSINSAQESSARDSLVKRAEVIVASGDKTVSETINVLPSNRRIVNTIKSIMSKYESTTDAVNNLSSYSSEQIKTGDKTKNIVTIQKEDTSIPDPTYVASDPDKPEEESNSMDESDDSYTKFNTAYLYARNEVINIDKNNYKNKLANKDISKNDIIATFNGGIITQKESTNPNDLSSYRLSLNEYLQQETVVQKNEFNTIPIEQYKNSVSGDDGFHHGDVSGNVRTDGFVKYRYSYGFDNIVAAQMSVGKTAGYISEYINVDGCMYIELNADVTDGVEYYVIDGKKETPILPLEQSLVKEEKLFYGLMPRFNIMNPNDIVVKHNGKSMNINSLTDLELLLSVNNTGKSIGQSQFLREDLYTIDYEPDSSARMYYPKNKKIRIKIIQRILDATKVAEPIKSVIIRKHGNQSSWYLSSRNTDVITINAEP